MMNNNNSNNKNTQQHHYGMEFSLFVGDLPYDCSDDKLQRLFQSKYKSVKRVQIIRTEDGSSRGFGFIRFEEKADFQAALAEGMKLDNTQLRLDTAHRSYKSSRTRYSSFNSSSSNSSNHHHNHHPFNNSNSTLHHHHHHQQHQHHDHQSHHHHHNQAPSHQQHGSQQHHPPNQQGQNSKLVITDQATGGQQNPNSSGPHGGNAGNSRITGQLQHTNLGPNLGGPNSSAGPLNHSHNQPTHQQQQQHHNVHLNHNTLNQSQQKGNQHHQGPDSRGSKQLGHGLGGDEASPLTQNKPQSSSQPARPGQHQPNNQASSMSQSQTQPNLSHIGANIPSSSMAVTSTAVTSLPSSDISHPVSGLQSNQHSINTVQPMLGSDMRAYAQTPMMDNPHMLGGPDPSMMPPSSVYGHMYPYGPPPTFGYMPPPPQPNPVIPISAVPPAPPNQASSSGVGHSLAATGTNRYNSPHQQQQHSHQTQPAHATAVDANAMSAMTAAGVQAQHQTPFYYYYPSPLYFDQTGATAPPNMYHPQSFHPQFFAMPNPAYLPNAHTYPTQHPTQAPLASQSDANAAPLVNQQQQQQQQQQPPAPSLPPPQQQVNLRNRDIDAPIE